MSVSYISLFLVPTALNDLFMSQEQGHMLVTLVLPEAEARGSQVLAQPGQLHEILPQNEMKRPCRGSGARHSLWHVWGSELSAWFWRQNKEKVP